MYGQMTAGSWIYIGTQGIVQGTYETFVEAGRQHYDGNLTGKWILTGGLGGMGGAQPLAAVMAGACCLAVECNPELDRFPPAHPLRRRQGRNARRSAGDDRPLDEGWRSEVRRPARQLPPKSSPRWSRRGIRPDMVTDQTSAHDPVNGYLPMGWTMGEWKEKRVSDPKAVEKAARASMRVHVEAMIAFQDAGRTDLRLRQQHPPGREG